MIIAKRLIRMMLQTTQSNKERESGTAKPATSSSTTVGIAVSMGTNTAEDDPEYSEGIKNLPIPQVDTIKPSIEEILNHYESVLNEINLPFYKTYDTDVGIILNNVRNRLKYLRLDAHGPKLGEINKRQV
jgi:hypothetical protein